MIVNIVTAWANYGPLNHCLRLATVRAWGWLLEIMIIYYRIIYIYKLGFNIWLCIFVILDQGLEPVFDLRTCGILCMTNRVGVVQYGGDQIFLRHLNAFKYKIFHISWISGTPNNVEEHPVRSLPKQARLANTKRKREKLMGCFLTFVLRFTFPHHSILIYDGFIWYLL